MYEAAIGKDRGLSWYLDYMKKRYDKHDEKYLTWAYAGTMELFATIFNYTGIEFNLMSASEDCRLGNEGFAQMMFERGLASS